jgi:hypothetical protein
LIGVTQINKYIVESGDMEDTKNLCFSVKDPKLNTYGILFVSVPTNTEKQNLPIENHEETLFAGEKFKKLLNKIDFDEQDYLTSLQKKSLKTLIKDNCFSKFDQSLIIKGRVYFTFMLCDPNGGGPAARIVCRIDKSNIKPVYVIFEETD